MRNIDWFPLSRQAGTRHCLQLGVVMKRKFSSSENSRPSPDLSNVLINSWPFPGLENSISNSRTFPEFPTAWQPCTAHKTPSAQEVETLKLQRSTYNSFFTGEIQEDACECLMLLIEIMDKGFEPCPTNYNINSKGSFSELLFSFVLGKYTICDICTMKSPAFETTSLLYDTPTDSSSMQELLMQEHKQKLYKTCSGCGRDTWHIESKFFLQPPKYLIIIVNRITYSNNRITKNKSRIPLDLYIELSPYKFSLQASVDHHGYSYEQWSLHSLYQLLWETFHCNDNKITECNITDTYNSSTAYILMYKLMVC